MVTRDEDAAMSAAPAEVGARTYATTLAALLDGIAAPPRDVAVSGLALDSRHVTPGAAFLACPGRTGHGLAHVAAAIANGCGRITFRPQSGSTGAAA